MPNLPNTLLNEFTNKLFNFIWDGKPDEVKRDVMLAYNAGGLKMLDIKQYIKGLKLSWIRRIIKENSNYSKLLFLAENISLCDLIYTGPNKIVKNPFWQEVFNAWTELQNKLVIKDEYEFISMNIWRNKQIKIGNQTIFYRDWANKGIWLINDLLKEDGQFMNLQEFQNKFNINTNFLRYQSLLSAIKSSMKSLNINSQRLYKIIGPVIPVTIKTFLKSSKGSKDMYRILISKTSNINSEEKWSNVLDINELPWYKIYKLPFKTTKNTKIQWLQYRMLHRILGTNDLLYKIKLKESNRCDFCKESVETIEHIFWSCPKIIDLWEKLNTQIYTKLEIELPLNLYIVLCGILENSEKTISEIKVY